MSTETTQIPQVQKVWRVVGSGLPAKALKLEEIPVPSDLQPGEVLVKIQAAALNPVGYKLMKMLPNWLAKRPHVAENDFAGVVVDANGTAFANGDEVFGWIPTDLQQKTSQGCLAQYARVPVDYFVKKPNNITPTEAAGITLTAATAYKGLVEIAQIEEGQSVFINGGSSSVGIFAIQIAKSKGCKVVASCSSKNTDFVKSLGADEVLDYKASPLSQQLTTNPPTPKFHVIFDCIGLTSPELYTKSAPYLAPNGIFVTVGFNVSSLKQVPGILRTAVNAFLIPAWLGGVKPKWKVFVVTNRKERLDDIRKLVQDGTVKPVVDSTYEFEDALKAFDKLMSERAVGKVVVNVV
ncbi:NAD(P)-binding protein [Rickenella mellea]|uniref:NAD(P)-binding protein n=1 Tax=Rickenella mellea TaxID=50990 RepID=A0A4Y7QIU8_9AGAM|nr:NAD(P)-binding protein [Rickenella mellea]